MTTPDKDLPFTTTHPVERCDDCAWIALERIKHNEAQQAAWRVAGRKPDMLYDMHIEYGDPDERGEIHRVRVIPSHRPVPAGLAAHLKEGQRATSVVDLGIISAR